MKRHQTASAIRLGTRKERGAPSGVAGPAQPADDTNKIANGTAPNGNTIALPSAAARRHTLILTGELDRRSAHALEAEIERLCEEGVTGITLDLRELTYIDSIGVAVIVYRSGLCKRRGHDLALVPGSRMIQRAFETAGVEKLLAFHEDEVVATRLPALAVGHRSRDAC